MIKEPKQSKPKDRKRFFPILSKKKIITDTAEKENEKIADSAPDESGNDAATTSIDVPDTEEDMTEVAVSQQISENVDEIREMNTQDLKQREKHMVQRCQSTIAETRTAELSEEMKRTLYSSRSLPVFTEPGSPTTRKSSNNSSLSTEEARRRLKSWKKTTIYRT